MRNIYLTGMMGSGKSSVGRRLAERVGYQFVDTDQLIEESTGRTISSILAEDGDEAFSEFEFAAVTSVPLQECVIATGGRTYLDKKCREFMDETGKVIFIDTSIGEIGKRLNPEQMKKRGFNVENKEELSSVLEKIRRERVSIYKIGTMAVNGNGAIDEVCDLIIRGFKNEKIRSALREGIQLTSLQEDPPEEDVEERGKV